MHIELLTDYEKTQLGERQPLPDEYRGLSDAEMELRLAAAKAALGKQLVVLGHHYQRDEVIRFADYIGDSLKLSQFAASQRDARFVVFCGVHFMAESADVLAAPGQHIILPDLAAGCSMADMAAIDQLEVCWQELAQLGVTSRLRAGGASAGVVPVTYINSAAAIKAFCGEHGGVVCTSSNAATVMGWAWRQAPKILMLPDQHLGRNTAYRMGVPLDQMVVWDPDLPYGGIEPDELRRAKLILWKGHCSVHTRFTTRQIDQFRAAHPGGRVVVHPECTFDVVQAADESGSTEYILETVRRSPEGSVWAVGTEIHLVHRLAAEAAPVRTVVTLDSLGCLCSTMFRVSPNHLLWVLEGLLDGDVHNRIVVPEPDKQWARTALNRMLELV
jgi:quinolinate synthase